MWAFVLTDAFYNPVGEIINAQDRKVTVPLSKLDTLSLKVRLDNPLAEALSDCEGYIKAYRDGGLEFLGPIITAEEVGDATGATVAINAVSSGWYLNKFHLDPWAPGTPDIFDWPTPNDRAQIIDEILNGTGAGGYVLPGPLNSSASTITYSPPGSKKVWEVLTELSTGLDGFDWRILPIESQPGGTGIAIGQFYARPVIGETRENAVFEWGGGRYNIVDYKRTTSRDTQANSIWLIDSTGNDVVATSFDTSGTSTVAWDPLEDIITTELTDPAAQQQLADEHVRVRSLPRRTIEFTPHVDPQRSGRIPYYGTDYTVGDRIRARAMYAGRTRFDAYMRVWAVTFDIDNNGVEKASLTLSEE
jgi:hypothetical protein